MGDDLYMDAHLFYEENKMTSPAKMALDAVNNAHRLNGCLVVDVGYEATIRAALKLMDEVQRYPVSSGSTWNDAVAHTINHLKQTAGV